MAAIDFPNSPSNGQVFIEPSGAGIYVYDGVKWISSVTTYNLGMSGTLDFGILDGSAATGTIDYGSLT